MHGQSLHNLKVFMITAICHFGQDKILKAVKRVVRRGWGRRQISRKTRRAFRVVKVYVPRTLSNSRMYNTKVSPHVNYGLWVILMWKQMHHCYECATVAVGCWQQGRLLCVLRTLHIFLFCLWCALFFEREKPSTHCFTPQMTKMDATKSWEF